MENADNYTETTIKFFKKRDLGKLKSLHIHFLQIYPIKERKDRTRLALIICNREFDHLPRREGAELDITGMKALLEGLGYSVEVEENLTAKVRGSHPPQTCVYYVLNHNLLSIQFITKKMAGFLVQESGEGSYMSL